MYTTCYAHQLITSITDQIETFHESQVVGKIGNLPPRQSRRSYIHNAPYSNPLLDNAQVSDLSMDENDLKGAEDDRHTWYRDTCGIAVIGGAGAGD